jgi:hypothetical protein
MAASDGLLAGFRLLRDYFGVDVRVGVFPCQFALRAPFGFRLQPFSTLLLTLTFQH